MKTINSKLVTNVLSCDPGSVNFGLSVISVSGKKFKIKHLAMLKNTIKDLKNEFREKLRIKFRKEIIKLVKKYNIDTIVIERFQNRGRFASALGEYVTFMISMIEEIVEKYNVKVYLYVASEWKNRIKRESGNVMATYYKMAKPKPPHILDALHLGLYHCDIPFSIKNIEKVKLWEPVH